MRKGLLETVISGMNTRTSHAQVVNELGRAIIAGEYEPGAALTEPELARRYGVSRAPLREALRRLEERQLLERNPYRGMRVIAPSARMIEQVA